MVLERPVVKLVSLSFVIDNVLVDETNDMFGCVYLSIERITGHQFQGLMLGPHHHRPFLPSGFPIPHDAHLVLRGQDPLTLRLPPAYQGNFRFAIQITSFIFLYLVRYRI